MAIEIVVEFGDGSTQDIEAAGQMGVYGFGYTRANAVNPSAFRMLNVT